MENEKNKISTFDVQKQREQEILKIIKSDLPIEEKKQLLDSYHESDIADILPLLSLSERTQLFSAYTPEELSEYFAYLEDPTEIIEDLDEELVADIVDEMPSDDAVDFLQELDEDKKQQIIELLEEETAKDVELISAYSEDLIGSLMTTDFVCFNKSLTVKQAMNELIKQAGDTENISTIYVTEENGTFYGAIKLRDLFIARSTTPLDDIILTSFPYFYANSETSESLPKIKEYDEESLPVLDADNRLIGALTSNDVLEAVEEEIQEDYAKLAGLTQEEDLQENLFKSVFKRLPWLIALLGLSFLVSALIGTFDAVIALLPLIVFFQPMILGMSGNSGTQSLGVTVRSLSDGETGKTALSRIFKEVRICFINGFLLAIISLILLTAYIVLFKAIGFSTAITTSACISISLLVSMTVSGFCGSAIPMLFKKIGIDPATASGPFITTLNDLISALTYYGLATLLLL